jgi:uncharacterized membrane protein YgaE (UPF0421/DUF939 family)
MHISANAIQDIIIAVGLIGGSWGVYKANKSKIPAQTIKNLEDSNASYETLDKTRQAEIKDLNDKLDKALKAHADDRLEFAKELADLNGQVKVYKELPLQELAAGIRDLASGQNEIIKALQASASIAKDAQHDGGLLVQTKDVNPLKVEINREDK